MAHMNAIVCPSQRVVDKLEEYEIEAPKFIIPTGIDVSKFIPEESVTSEWVREKYGIQEDETFLLSVSRISYEKNIQAILNGMPEVVKDCPNVKLLIVGNGPYKKDLEELAEVLDLGKYVIFTGEIPNEEISPIYQAADVFVSASSSETQGLTYTEAMAAKTKVVAKGNDYLNPLFNDLSLGVTFESDEDFSSCLVNYLKEDHPHNEELLNKKLFEISSEAFGLSVEKLYSDVIGTYEVSEKEEETEDEAFDSLRIFRK